jgi:hypothetical protein
MANTINLKLTKLELSIMAETLHSITIKGSDAFAVGTLLGKVYNGLNKFPAEVNAGEQKTDK